MATPTLAHSRIELPNTIREAVKQGYECDGGCDEGAPDSGKTRGILIYTKNLGNGHVSTIRFPYLASFKFGRRVRK